VFDTTLIHADTAVDFALDRLSIERLVPARSLAS
jgi:hypothetical protein